jgi:hypothetical protein
MSTKKEKLSPKQEAAVLALLVHRSNEEAARAVNVSAKTIARWLKDPLFAAEYREARRATFNQTVARLQQMSPAAATTLGKVMVDPGTPASTKVRAAAEILAQALKAAEIEDIEVRVAELERAAEAKSK